MVHPIKGYDLKTALNTRDSVFLNEMKYYSIPTLDKDPSQVILHIGTDNLRSSCSAEDIAADIIRLARDMKKDCNEINVSSIIGRRDKWNGKARSANDQLRNLCYSFDIGFLDYANINNNRDLNGGELHLNNDGVDKLFFNILDTIKS